ncbi:hypothetical protein ACFFYR_38140 [Paraburkholderia dipogonis]|uniref:hypothetical protein n=1 Tax=Paraburkholderia dipogonis TaxID=1211383 RepID=UPI0035EDD27C
MRRRRSSFDWRQFDAATLLKASQALSSEIELDGLIERLMTIALQISGADRGLLVCAAAAGRIPDRSRSAHQCDMGIVVEPGAACPSRRSCRHFCVM